MGKYSKVIFFDRDGTLNVDPGYLSDPALVTLIPGVSKALGLLRRSGYELVVVTNQSAVARGKATLGDVERVNERIAELLLAEDADATLSGFLICPHGPDDGCRCRKPGTLLVEEWCRQENGGALPEESWFIGDKESDIRCGRALGIPAERCLQVRSGEGGVGEFESVVDCVQRILLNE